MGIQPARKSNAFTEMFVRYKPRDYKGLLVEFNRAMAIMEVDGKRVGK